MLKITIPRALKYDNKIKENPRLLYLYVLLKYKDYYKLEFTDLYKYYDKDILYRDFVNVLQYIKRKYHKDNSEIPTRYVAVWENIIGASTPDLLGKLILLKMNAKNGVLTKEQKYEVPDKFLDGDIFNDYYIPLCVTDKYRH